MSIEYEYEVVVNLSECVFKIYLMDDGIGYDFISGKYEQISSVWKRRIDV